MICHAVDFFMLIFISNYMQELLTTFVCTVENEFHTVYAKLNNHSVTVDHIVVCLYNDL